MDLVQRVNGSQRYLASCVFYLIHCKILFAFLPVDQNISHIFVFAYAVNWSCIALLISASCSKSFKIYFLLSLLHILLNNYTFPHPSKPPPVQQSGPTVFEHVTLLYGSSNHCNHQQDRKMVQVFSWDFTKPCSVLWASCLYSDLKGHSDLLFLQKYIGIAP